MYNCVVIEISVINIILFDCYILMYILVYMNIYVKSSYI